MSPPKASRRSPVAVPLSNRAGDQPPDLSCPRHASHGLLALRQGQGSADAVGQWLAVVDAGVALPTDPACPSLQTNELAIAEPRMVLPLHYRTGRC